MSGRVNVASLEEFTDDPRNANKGTERGKKMLDKSLTQLGAGRSILVDKNGVIIAGNKTRQAMVEAGMLNARVVETDGNELVVVKRTDLDLMERGGKARQLAYADNQVAKADIDYDCDAIEADLAEGVDLSDWFSEQELASITLERVTGETDANAEWGGMPEFDNPDATSARSILVHFRSNEDAESFARLIAQEIGPKCKSIWHPKLKRADYKDKGYVGE